MKCGLEKKEIDSESGYVAVDPINQEGLRYGFVEELIDAHNVLDFFSEVI